MESEWFLNLKQTLRSNIQAYMFNDKYGKYNRFVNILAVTSVGAACIHP